MEDLLRGCIWPLRILACCRRHAYQVMIRWPCEWVKKTHIVHPQNSLSSLMGKWAPKISAARVQSLVDENWILNLTELAWSFANTTMLSARAIALNVYEPPSM